jgi:hypothetical protein
MEALALRLSHLDSHAEGAIRVVMFCDTLIPPAGGPPGARPASAAWPSASPGSGSTAPITLDEEEIGTVWLERPGPPNPLDELLLDRLAIAAPAVLERYCPARTTMADPALRFATSREPVVRSDTLGAPPTSSTCTTAASRAGSNSSERPWAPSSPSPPA